MVTNRLVTSLMGSTSDESKLRFRLRLYTLLSFIAALVLCAAFAVLSWKALLLSGQKTAAVIAANQSSVLEERLSRSLSSTYALASVLRQGHGEIDNFETLATEMLHLYGGISSLQLARRGVISAIVPLAGNEKAMGHDVLNDPARSKEAQLALRSRSLTLAGPFTLLQGGVAVTGRLPVFLPNARGEEEFWGFTTALIRIPSLLETSTLPQLINDGYHYELSHVDPDTGLRTVFAQSNTQRLQDPVVHTIEVPNGKWFLSIAPTHGWAPPSLPLLMGVAAMVIALLVAFFTHTTLKQPLLLQHQVALRTGELAQSNRELSLEIAERESAQAAVARLNRLYSALSHTNGAIVRINEKNALLQEICRIAVEYGGFPLAKIAMLDQTRPQREWIATCGLDVALPDCNQQASCASRDAAALNGQALRVCSSIKEDSAIWHPVCSQALDAGFASHVVLPLILHGQVAGLFSLYAYEPNCFDEAQLQLLKEMSTDLSFALTNIEHEALHRKGEENLRKLSRAVEQSANAVLITNRDGVIEYINPWFTKITGYSAEEIIGKSPRILKSIKTHPETHRRMWETLLSGREWTGELHNTKKNGELYWCMETISPLKNEAGEVTHFVAITEDISERKQNEETIRHLAFHDALTGLPNRRLFRDRLYQAAAVAERNGEPFALMLLDLDRFKTVNDTLGHDIGDELLKAVSERLSGNTRKGDTLARMGGDEFAMIAIGISQPEPMVALTQNLLEVLKAPFQLRGHQLYVTTSVGITLYPGDTGEVDALIKNADIALYRAKDQGRNGYQFFTGDMNAAMLHRLHLDNSMRWAIERGEFMLHFQPQIDILSGAIHGTEALIRWQHPEFGLVSPAQFIPLAEETGMIVPISEWVLRTACAQGKAWERAGNPMRIAVNLSARQFRQANLAEQIAGFLKDADLSPSLLEVELTEGTLMEDSAQTTAILDKLHQMGVQISIDDFGTGYSSLSYLKRLPIQLLKIDQSFVHDIGTDPDDRAIVTAVIALAHSLKMKVVAEGVETREQLAFLREQGCDEMQGYLYSRPVPGNVLLGLLQANTRLLF